MDPFRPAILPTGYERTLPPEVQLLVRARRRALVAGAAGQVLDLGGADAHQGLWTTVPAVTDSTVLDGADDVRLHALARDGVAFDTVFSVFQLASASDLDATLRRIASVLTEDGCILFIEPGRLTGTAGRLQRLVAPPVGLATGWRVDRDIPMSMRTAGLSVTDLERHRIPTIQWWVRVITEGRAHHALPLGTDLPADGA